MYLDKIYIILLTGIGAEIDLDVYDNFIYIILIINNDK